MKKFIFLSLAVFSEGAIKKEKRAVVKSNVRLLNKKSATKIVKKSVNSHQKRKNENQGIKTTFGYVSQNTSIRNVNTQNNFFNFLSNFKEGCELKQFEDRFIGYFVDNCAYVFDVKTKTIHSLVIKGLNRTDQFQSFAFDGQYYYVKLRRSVRVFDLKGREKASYLIPNREISGSEVVVSRSVFYVISRSRDILAFKFNKNSRALKLLFENNDFHSTKSNNFSFKAGRDVVIHSGNRVSLMHRLSGKVLFNVYLRNYVYDNLQLYKNKAFVYAKNSFASIDLQTHKVTYSDFVMILGKKLLVRSGKIIFDRKIYRGNYVFTKFGQDSFIRYVHNTYDSRFFLIKGKSLQQFILKKFAISNVFLFNNRVVLVDIKSCKIVVL